MKAWRDGATRQRVLSAGPSGEAHDVMAIQEVHAAPFLPLPPPRGVPRLRACFAGANCCGDGSLWHTTYTS